MPQIILPALLSGITIGVGATGAIAFGFSVSTFALNAVLGAALYVLTPQPKAQEVGPQTLTFKSPNESRKLIYGKDRVGGVVVFAESTDDDRYLHMVVVFAAHEVNAFSTFYMDEEEITLSGNEIVTPTKLAGLIKIYPVTVGSVPNIPASLIADTSWTINHILTDQAYVYFRMERNGDDLRQVPNISVITEGRIVYDTRTSTTIYSTNPAMIVRDYLLDATYGVGAVASEIDTTSFEAAANICDELVSLAAGGTEKRFELEGVVDTKNTLRANLGAMLTSMDGTLFYSNGKWHVNAGAYITPTVTIDEDDLAGPIKAVTAVSIKTSYNAIKGQYTSPESSYQPTDYAEITSATFETEDNNSGRKYGFLNLPYTKSGPRAQRIAKQTLYKNRQKIVISAKFKLSAFKFNVGDTLMVNNTEWGFSSKVFEVTSWELIFSSSEVSINCVMRETNSAVFSWIAEETLFAQDNTTLPNPNSLVAPTNFALVAGSTTNGDGTISPKITATWDVVTTGFISGYEFQYKLTASSDYTALTGTSGEAVIEPVISGNGYSARLRAISSAGARSTWVTATLSATGDTTAPALPTGLTATGAWKGNNLLWVRPADADFSHVEVWAYTSDVSGSATKVGESGGTEHFHGGLVNESTRYYWLKSVDFSGNASAFTTSVNAVTFKQLDEATQLIGKLRTRTTGERVEIEDDLITVYDPSNMARVKIGDLS